MNIVALGDICEFVYGKALPKTRRETGPVPVYGSNGVVGTHTDQLSQSETIVIGRKGSVGELNYSSAPCWPIDTTYYVDRSSTTEDIRWLFYALHALRLPELNKATGVPGLNRNDAYERKIFRPAPNEQRRIAAILDGADVIIRKREKALALADDFVRSLFEGMFFSSDAKWPTAKFSEVAELINGDRSSNYPSGSDIVSGGVLFVSTKNIVDSKLSLNTRAFITPEKFRSLTRGKLRKNDLIVTLRGSVGQAAIFDCEYETGFINAQIMIVRPSAVLHSSYLHQLFTHPKFQQQLLAGQSGSATPQLTAGQIGRMEIPVPPISVQERFEHACREAEKLLKKLKSDFEDTTALFASLSQRAFRGEL